MLSKTQVRQIRERVAGDNRRLTLMFAALSDKGRFGIFRLFLRQHDLCVTDVAAVLGISVPAASQQLKVMELSGLVTKERNGQRICYAVLRRDPAVRSLIRIIDSFYA